MKIIFITGGTGTMGVRSITTDCTSENIPLPCSAVS